jgi:hypothetical protein
MKHENAKELPPNLRDLSEEVLADIAGGLADGCTGWPESTYVRRPPTELQGASAGGASLSSLIEDTLRGGR